MASLTNTTRFILVLQMVPLVRAPPESMPEVKSQYDFADEDEDEAGGREVLRDVSSHRMLEL